MPTVVLLGALTMRAVSCFTTFLSFCAPLVLADVSWDATPFNPASVPLAVRSPYLSAWLAQGAGTALDAAWPTFWTGSVSISCIHHLV